MYEDGKHPNVSIIIPIYNGEKWIDDCFESILYQTALKHNISIEVVVYDDASSDDTPKVLKKWQTIFAENQIICSIRYNKSGSPKGVGHAKNESVKGSSGEFLCFQDVDDIMLPDRILKQYMCAKSKSNMILGSKFHRYPPNSTERFTRWANNLNDHELNVQIYTSNGPTIIMPTWFCHRDVFEKVGGFSEDGRGVPEDLIFFYKHLDFGGKIYRVDEYLLMYNYHKEATTFSISSDSIWNIRLEHLQKKFLSKCNNGFTIWNAGKQGRKFLKSLPEEQRKLVISMCDVDVNKIGKLYELYCPNQRKVLLKIPIIHYKNAKPPIVICVKMDMTDGEFENNLASLNLTEGLDYVLFS